VIYQLKQSHCWCSDLAGRFCDTVSCDWHQHRAIDRSPRPASRTLWSYRPEAPSPRPSVDLQPCDRRLAAQNTPCGSPLAQTESGCVTAVDGRFRIQVTDRAGGLDWYRKAVVYCIRRWSSLASAGRSSTAPEDGSRTRTIWSRGNLLVADRYLSTRRPKPLSTRLCYRPVSRWEVVRYCSPWRRTVSLNWTALHTGPVAVSRACQPNWKLLRCRFEMWELVGELN